MKYNGKKKPLIVIAGPTASGKTGLSVRIAKKIGARIISADSMQIYRYMNIGTAKPDENEREGVVHHMLDVVYPNEPYSVYDYSIEAKKIIDNCHKEGIVPIMAGGTGLYINNVIYNIKLSGSSGDEKVRQKLSARLEKEGIKALYSELEKIDPQAAVKIHINNTKRVLRALEVFYQTGKTITEQNRISRLEESPYDVLFMIPSHEREILYRRINQRVEAMFDMGLESEVKSLIDMGYARELNSMQAIGYKEMYAYFAGEIDLNEAKESIKQNTRHYAKRQITWFKRNEEAVWLSGDFYKQAMEKAEKFLSE